MSFPETMSTLKPIEESVPPNSNSVAMKACALPLPTRIAFVGNYLPRECGIATFTTDLCTALTAEFGEGRLFAIPVNDPDSSYEYPEQVRLELTQDDLSSYERAAEFLNFNGNDLVCLQHEYGIFGGPAGRYILAHASQVDYATGHNVPHGSARAGRKSAHRARRNRAAF